MHAGCGQDPGADVARAVLQPAAEHLGQQLTAARSTLPTELHNPLNQLGGVPYFALSRRSFLGTCSEAKLLRLTAVTRWRVGLGQCAG